MRVETKQKNSIEEVLPIDTSFGRVGGVCSIAVGISYFLAAATYLLQPREMLYHTSEFWPLFVQNSKLYVIHLVYHYNRSLGALLAIAVIMAVSEIMLKSTSKGWLRWISTLACIGLAVETVNNLLKVGFEIRNASVFATGDASTQAAIVAAHSWIDIDPQGIIRYSTLSLWFLVVSVLAIRYGIFSKALNYVGITVAFSFFFGGTIAMTFQDYSFVLSIVAVTAGIGGMIMMPTWYIWMGSNLLKARLLYRPESKKMQLGETHRSMA